MHIFFCSWSNLLVICRAQPYDWDKSTNMHGLCLQRRKKRWLKVLRNAKNLLGAGVWTQDYVLMPINQNRHWALAIVCHPGMQHQSVLNTDTTVLGSFENVLRTAIQSLPYMQQVNAGIWRLVT